jgi:FtsZ-interacting cell division protein YlmF
MASVVHKAMVWLGITDDEEELEAPVIRSQQYREPRSEYNLGQEPRVREEAFAYAGASRAAEERKPQSRVQLLTQEPLQVKEPYTYPAPQMPSSQELHSKVREVQEEPTQVFERRSNVVRPLKSDGPKVHLAVPSKFADVQEIADHMKGGRPVIVNIEGLDTSISRRVIDFCSGLTYALGGKIKKVAEQVYLITPAKVEVTEEDMERITERAVLRGN